MHTNTDFDILLVSPPIMHAAVAPAVALPALKAYLSQRSQRAAVRDLNAEMLYELFFSPEFIRRFLSDLKQTNPREQGVYRFMEAEWSHSCFSRKHISECGVDELERSVRTDSRARAFYYRCVSHLYGLEARDYHLRQFKVQAEADHPFLDEFFRKHLATWFERGFPRVLGISITETDQLLATMRLASLVRQHSPETIVVLGGAWCLASAPLHKLFLETFPWIFGIVNYEGEVPLSLIIEGVRANNFLDIPGLMYREGERVIEASRFETIPMDQLPIPDFRDLPLHLYPAHLLPVQTYRGCSWGKCIFCIGQESASPREQRSPARIVELMEQHLIQTGCTSFFTGDSSTPLSSMVAIADELLARGLKLQWSALTRAEVHYTPEICRKLYRSGLRYLYVGLETLSAEHLKLLKKGIAPDEFFHTARLCADAGLHVIAFVMNFPTNTLEDLDATFEAIHLHREALDDMIVQSFRLPLATEAFRNPSLMGISVLAGEAENLEVFGLEFSVPGTERLDNKLFVEQENKAVRRFHVTRGSVPRTSPDLWTEAGQRRRLHPHKADRSRVVLAALDQSRTGCVPGPLDSARAFLRRDPEITDQVELQVILLPPGTPGDLEALPGFESGPPALAALYCEASDPGPILDLCDRIRAQHPGVPLLAAGPGVRDAARILAAHPSIDLVVPGALELPLEAVVHRLVMQKESIPAGIPGLAMRTDGGQHLPTAVCSMPLDHLPTRFISDVVAQLSSCVELETCRAPASGLSTGFPGSGAELNSLSPERISLDLAGALSNRRVRVLRLSEPVPGQDPARLRSVLTSFHSANRHGARLDLTLSRLDLGEEILAAIEGAGIGELQIRFQDFQGQSPAELRRRGLADHLRVRLEVSPADSPADQAQALRWCWDQELFRVVPVESGDPPATSISREESPGSLIRAYSALASGFEAGDLRLLKAQGVDLVTKAEELVCRGGLKGQEPGVWLARSLAESREGELLVSQIRDLSAYRSMERELRKAGETSGPAAGPRDLEQGAQLRIVGYKRLIFINDIKLLLQGKVPLQAPRAPEDWFFLATPGTGVIIPMRPAHPEEFEWMLKLLVAPRGSNARDLVRRVCGLSRELSPKLILAMMRSLAAAGLLAHLTTE